MEWYTLFRQHILDRGIQYFEDGYVSDFVYSNNSITASVNGSDIYDVEIILDGENVVDMYCSCPHAAGGNYCKHMAAVLFKFEEMLAEQDAESEYDIDSDVVISEEESIYGSPSLDYLRRFNKQNAEVVELVSKIPEDKVRELLAGFVLADDGLKNKLQMQYDFKMNSKLMLELRKELNQIEYHYCRGGYVDWYHASDFTTDLCVFLDSKVQMLIEKNCLKQAFELTNSTFFCIGNVDMDDSDGSSSYVLERCYECWEQILEKSDAEFRHQMKLWFENHRTGYVLDFMDEYIEEILFEHFATKEMIAEEMEKLDAIINKHVGNDCGRYYSVHHGSINPILKRIEYMKKMDCSTEKIAEYRKQNRRFFVVRELEIAEAIEAGNYEIAIEVLLESKRLDAGNQEQLKKYSEQLIDIYKTVGDFDVFSAELIHFLESYWQYDLTYVEMLKSYINDKMKWNEIVDGIVAKNKHDDFVCILLNEEKRYEQLVERIEKSSSKVNLLDKHERILRKKTPDRVIKIYAEYLEKAVDLANDRNKYKGLMVYLKKISQCLGGDVVAREIADTWRREYKRRSAMMDELRKSGF